MDVWQFRFFLGAIHEKHKFKYLKNLTVKVCKIWCNDVYMSILQCDIFWWKLIDRNLFNPIFKKMKFQIWWVTFQINQRLSRACIVHLVIKRTNGSYVKIMSCSGSHLGITINIKNTKFVKDLPMIDAQFRFNRCNSFREEYISVFSPYGPVLILWPVVAAILDFRSA